MRPWLALAFVVIFARANGAETLRNERYQLDLEPGGSLTVTVAGMPPQQLVPEFTVLEVIRIPDCRGTFVLSEADLKLPRAQVSIAEGNTALVADQCEFRFRLPTVMDSRFGLMLAEDSGQLRPVVLAPLLGGTESHRDSGQVSRFKFRFVTRSGSWQETFRHIA